jgi:hypothetical protein
MACGGVGDDSLAISDAATDTTATDGATPTDAASDAPSSPDVISTFDPKSVTGLVLWLHADIGVTADNAQHVSAWADQSGNNNNATETRDGIEPTLVAAGINAHPTIHFASVASAASTSGFQGNDLSIADSATMEWGTSDFLVELVARYTNDPTSLTHDAFGALYIAIYGPPNASNAGLGLYGNVWSEPGDLATSSAIEAYVWGQPSATSSATGFNNDAAHVFAIQRVGTTLSVRIDGASAGSQTIASTDVGKTGGRLGGCENAQAQRLEGDISEVIAVKGVIAPSDLVGIESYLKNRYATP